MKIKHKLLQDFQYVSPDKKIFVLKSGTVLEEYNYKVKSDIIPIDKDLVDANPQFFELIDWKVELLSFMKVNKMPQPSQLGKKLIPFIEEMVLSSIQQNSQSFDPNVLRDIEKRESEILSKKRDLDKKESEIESRERRVKDKEDDIEIKLKRTEKREEQYKTDLQNLDKKEDELRAKVREFSNNQLEYEDKLRELNERERNLDRNTLLSSQEIDSKYAELQAKIDKDVNALTNKEKELDSLTKEIKNRESSIIQQEAELSDRVRNFEQRVEEINLEESSLMKLKNELELKSQSLSELETRLNIREMELNKPTIPR
jgi:hypothetical protein